MTYTAAEMREMAVKHDRAEAAERSLYRSPDNVLANMHQDTAAMLRQAAEAMDGTTKEGE